MGSSNQHPPSFACPLTLEVMHDPVSDPCGHTFERTAITEWLRHDSCCPISRKPLDAAGGDLVTNHALAERIEKWQWQREVEDYIGMEEDLERRTLSIYSPSHEHGDSEHSVDVEMGQSSGQSRRQKKQRNQHHYEEIDSFMMFLPQERQLLELVQAREEAEQREKQRQRTLRRITAGIVLLAGLTFGAARVMMIE